MGSTWCRFMRDVQKGATLLYGGSSPLPIFIPFPKRAGPRKDSDTNIGGNKGMVGTLIKTFEVSDTNFLYKASTT